MVTDYSIDDEDLHHEVIVGSTSNLTVDTDEVLGVTSNLKQLPDDSNLKMKYSMTDEDASNMKRLLMIQNLKLNISLMMKFCQ